MNALKYITYKIKEDYYERKEYLNKNSLFSYLFNNRGYVLIIVLIVITLLISISGEFIVVSQTNIAYIRKFSSRIKTGYLARSGFELAKFILYADKSGISDNILPGKNRDKNIDCYNDIWAINFPQIPIGDGTIKIKIIDENSKINLSVLANEFADKTPYYSITQRFFLNMGLSTDFADILIDWVDIDDSSFPYGAESGDYYQSLSPPYSAKNNEMDSIDEMLMVKDMTPEIYYGLGGGNYGLEKDLTEHNMGNVSLDFDKALENSKGGEAEITHTDDNEEVEFSIGKEKSRSLQNYFRVNGSRNNWTDDANKININTASYRVISALTENMTDDVVTEIINRRLMQPFKSVNDLKDLIDSESFENLKKNIITVKSVIFKIITIAEINDTQVKITAVYNRDSRRILYWSEE